ncbi:MAG: hypothetical protein R3D88_06705 [Alphaproteobacteria bacterium]|nr:hypothetical protein [Alphaproteobacteria bacterium]
MDHHTEKGNVFIFILLAIALLGLLTVALSRSSSDSNETGDFERQQIIASDILNYTKSIEIAVQNLLARGCGENSISFWHDSNGDGTEDGSDDYYNAGAPTDHSCHIFKPEGTGLAYAAPKTEWLDSNFSASADYGNIIFTGNLHKPTKTDVAGNTLRKKDLIIIFPYLNQTICQRVNLLSEAAIASTNPPKEDDTDAANFKVKFTGAFTLGSDIDGNGSDPAANVFTNVDSGCTRPDDEDSFMAFYVLNHRD